MMNGGDPSFVRPVGQKYDILVIGAGYCGAMAVAHLVRLCEKPTLIGLIDKGEPGLGLAYKTKNPGHLLNIPAEKIGAYDGAPEHFADWMRSDVGARAIYDCGLKHDAFDGKSFMPRRVYGQYLKGILQEAIHAAGANGSRVDLIAQQATDLIAEESGALTVKLDNGECLEAGKVILATGTGDPRPLATKAPEAVQNFWNEDLKARIEDIKKDPIKAKQPVLIVGSGLSAIDALISLRAAGYEGRVNMFSRGGALPAVHKPLKPIPFDAAEEKALFAAGTVNRLFLLVRKIIKARAKNGADWRQTIDALRPHTQALWRGLSVAEKNRFFKKYYGLWNNVRHRVAKEIGSYLKMQEEDGLLRVTKAALFDMTEYEGRFITRFETPKGRLLEYTPSLLLNCTGPETECARTQNPLLQNMLKRGYLKPHATGRGVDIKQDYVPEGDLSDGRLLVIGSALIGEAFETIAVSELRVQAKDAAVSALADLKVVS